MTERASVKPDTRPSMKKWALAGFVAGWIVEYAYLNLDTVERLAADAGGFPTWSVWQMPFALPGGAAGAVLACCIAGAIRFARKKRGTAQ